MLMSTVLPAIEFVWWQGRVLPWVESMWWQDKRSGIIEKFQCYPPDYIHIRFLHCGLVGGIQVNSKMVIVGVMLVTQHQVPFYYDTVLYSNSRLLYSTVKKKINKKKLKKMAGSSPGSEVLATLNHLPVTRSWNFRSTWANGDWHSIDSGMSPNNAKGPICRVLPNIPNLFPRSSSKTMREAILALVVGGGYDGIQDGGRKLIPTTHHPPPEQE